MGGARCRSAAASGVVRRIAIVVGVVLLATATVGAVADPASAADENASTEAGASAADAAATSSDPRVVDAAVHELDDDRAVLVVVVRADGGTETVVTELDRERGDADRDGAEPVPSVAEHPDALDIANLSGDGIDLGRAPGDGDDPSNEALDPNAVDDLANVDGAPEVTGNESPVDAGAPEAVDGSPIDGSVVDVPDALESPPERLTRAFSREPAFGGNWLLPGALAALGGAMATLGVGALAIWRRTI